MAFKTKTQLLADLAANFPTNVAGSITAAIYRTFIADVLDSYLANLNPEEKTASFTVDNTIDDGAFFIVRGASAVNVTLDEGSNFHDGYLVVVHRDGEPVHVHKSGNDTINGLAGPIVINKNFTTYLIIYLGSGQWYALPISINLGDVAAGSFPIGDGEGNLDPSSLTETVDRIVSSKTIEVPTGSLQLGGNIKIGAGGRCTFVRNLAYDRKELVHASPYDSAGSITPFYPWIQSAEVPVVHQPLDDEVVAVDQITYTVTDNNRIASALIIRGAVAQSGASLVIRKDDVFGRVLVQVDSFDILGTGDTRIDFPNPIAAEIGDAVHISMANMGSATLKGHTNGTFVPYFATVGQNYTKLDTDWPNDLIGAALKSGTANTITFTRRSGATFDVVIGGATFLAPHLTGFAMTGLPARIDTTASLAGNYSASVDVANSANVDGGLTVMANTTPIHTIAAASIVEGLNSFTVNISAAEWTSILGGSPPNVVIKVTGSDSQSAAFESNALTVERRDLDQHEYLYDGLSASNNPAAIDIAGMDQNEIGSISGQTISISTGATTAGQYYIILVPAIYNITIVDTVLEQDVTSIFSKTDDVRQINLVNFDSYVLGPLNAGGDETYNVTITTP